MIRHQPNRLAAETDKGFSGGAIDRSKPLTFRLNARIIHGFSGDTVLSAVLASGLTQAGTRQGEPLALDDRFAPPVVAAGHERERHLALPMDRMPAVAGLNLVTLGPRDRARPFSRLGAWFDSLGAGARHTLGHAFGGVVDLSGPWHDAAKEEPLETDLVVVGGGIAGMSAAVAAARDGERVVLLERRGELGGDVRFFGSVDEEESPRDIIDGLTAELAKLDGVTVLRNTEALAIYGRRVRAHQITDAGDKPAGRLLLIEARRVVLAPGAFERLPVFSGNRLPGVVRSVAAFRLAERYGVWLGKRALFNTASSFAYRLAMRLHGSEVEIQRITDTRNSPQSRFVDISKAYGIPLTFGMLPTAVTRTRRGLEARLAVPAYEGERQPAETFATEQFVVCGGWQPDLGLWHMAGGRSRWVPEANRMEPAGELEDVAVVGAAAGWRTNTACMQSATAAVAEFLGRKPEFIEDRQIDPVFETPDDRTPIAAKAASTPAKDEAATAYLDAGYSLAERPTERARAGLAALLARGRPRGQFVSQARALSMGDIAAGVQIGAIAEADAGTVAKERCVLPGDIVQIGHAATVVPKPLPADRPYPPYLEGRFGPKAALWLVAPNDNRTFEPGCLVYTNSDLKDPLLAVGVVIGPAAYSRTGAIALVGGDRLARGAHLVVRDISGAVRVELKDIPKAPPAEPPKPVEEPKPVEVVAPPEPPPVPQPTPEPAPVPATPTVEVVAAPAPPRMPRRRKRPIPPAPRASRYYPGRAAARRRTRR